MELNEMEKKLLFQVEGDYQTKILNELYMTVRYSNNSEQREAAEGLMAKLRVLSNVAPSTVRLWTSGAAQPCGTAKRLMQIYETGPEIVGKIAGGQLPADGRD